MTTHLQATLSSRQPVSFPQFRLRIYQQYLFARELWQEIPFGADGQLEVTLEPEGENNYHLALELVRSTESGEIMVVEERGTYCLGENIVVRFMVAAERFVLRYTELDKKITTELEDYPWEELQETQWQQLACMIGAGDRLVTRWRRAQEWTKTVQEYDVSPAHDLKDVAAIFYTLLEDDPQDQLHDLLLRTRGQLQATLDTAYNGGHIELPATEKATEWVMNLRERLFFSGAAELPGLARYLFLFDLEPTQKNELLDRLIEAGSLAQLVQNEQEGISNGVVEIQTLERILQVDQIAQQYMPMTQSLYKRLQQVQWQVQVYMLWSDADWLGFVNNSTQAPASYAQQADPHAAYAADTAQRYRSAFPQANIIALQETSELAYVIGNVLVEHPDFDIEQQAVSGYFTANPEVEDRVVLEAPVLAQLQQTQRLLSVVGGIAEFPAANLLAEANVQSAREIVGRGKHAFVNEMAELGDYDIGYWDKVYCRARSIDRLAKDVALQYRTNHQASLVPQVLQPLGGSTPDPSLDLPDMEALFGSLDSCACADCQSVFSPAAYLTDLLGWMRSDVICTQTTQSAYVTLDAPDRRPDIKYLQLNCANSHTLMPYIDLVNEVLLAHLEGNPDPVLLADLQTRQSAEMLTLEPEHVYRSEWSTARDKLNQVKYPLSLPYDVAATEATGYLKAMDINRADWYVELANHRYPHFHHDAWAKAYLKISDAEFDLITESVPSTDFWIDYLNLSAQTTNLGKLLAATEIDEPTFRAYYETQYVSGFTPLEPALTDFEACSWDEFEISSPWSDFMMHRMLRLLRLQRITGWRLDQLDKAIYAVNRNTLDARCLQRVASIQYLSEQLSMSIDDLLVWFSIDPFSASSNYDWSAYYDAIYRPASASAAQRDFFDPVFLNSSANTATVDNLTPEQEGWLMDIHGFAAGEVAQLNRHWFGGGSQRLTTRNLQFYHINAAFAKALGISISDLAAFYSVQNSPFDPYPNAPSEVTHFLHFSRAFSALNLPIQHFCALDKGEGRYALDSANTAVDPDFATEAQAAWANIASELQSLYQAQPTAYDASAHYVKISTTDGYPDLKEELYRHLGHTFGLEAAATQTIVEHTDSNWHQDALHFALSTTVTSPWLGNADQHFTPIFRQLYRIYTFSSALGMDAALMTEAVKAGILGSRQLVQASTFSWLTDDFTNSHYRDVIYSHRVIQQQQRLGLPVDRWFDYLEDARTTTDLDTLLTNLYSETAPTFQESVTIVSFKAAYQRAQALAIETNDLSEVLTITEKMHRLSTTHQLPVTTVWDWLWGNYLTPLMATSIGSHKAAIKAHLRSLHADAAQWAKLIKPIHDRFRRQLRDALTAYYTAHQDFENSSALYAHFLIDPEMDTCMDTSRIVQATQSVQLLLQRGMLGLEPKVCFSQDNFLEFDWRKQYRLWEANRKVFLYPENYLVPSLRHNKTDFFQQLEDQLLQDEVNAEHCEIAFGDYLHQLKAVARLDIRAFYQESEQDPNPGNYHLFARSFTEPYTYYYREWSAQLSEWSPWEQMEVDIVGNHLIPVFFRGRLHLFGVLFMEKEHRKIKRVIEGEEQNAPYLELQFYYFVREADRWSKKHMLKGNLLAGHYAGPGCFNNLRRKLGQDVDQVITHYEYSSPWKPPVPVYGPNESDNGNMVWSNGNYQGYAPVSLEQSAFFFHAEEVDGDLILQVYRDFAEQVDWMHNAYTEMVYEDWVRLNGCTGQLSIIPPIIEDLPLGKRFLARPFPTLPDHQQMVKGLDGPTDKPSDGLYVKTSLTHYTDGLRLLTQDHGGYQLTYPQAKHATWEKPFFLSDTQHTLFFERKTTRRCVRQWVIGADGVGYYRPYHTVAQQEQYQVSLHEHPLVCRLVKAYNQYRTNGVLDSRDPALRKQAYQRHFFPPEYRPIPTRISTPYPLEDFDFSATGAYSQYNWELFFHVPALMGHQLKAHGQFAEAIRWWSFIFDPTNRDHSGLDRVWRIKPFTQAISQDNIAHLLALLGATGLNPDQQKKRDALQAQINRWEDNPFEPHLLAALRVRSYMMWTVCEYIDTLIEWGDHLFRQDTRETINEATHLYLMAGELLGERPQTLDRPTKSISLTFADIADGLTGFSNSIENELTGYLPMACCERNPYQAGPADLPDPIFCVPDNPKLRELWDRVADRLFKIRHCMDIDGQKRTLALFAPPIDPMLLVRARAAGLDIQGVLDQVNSAPPHYRFSYLIQKAMEYTNDLKSLGGQLLSALEKRDAEELVLMRELNTTNLLTMSRNTRKMQVEEAKLQLEMAEHGRKIAEIRLAEYESREYINAREKKAMTLTTLSEVLMLKEKTTTLTGQVLGLIPQLHAGIDLKFEAGGRTLREIANTVALSYGIQASILRNAASRASTLGSYDRREDDRMLQVNTIKEELKSAEKQIVAAEIRLAIAENELQQHDLQVEQSQEMYDYLRSKFTNKELYTWMSGELSGLNYQTYKLAFDLAKEAERAMQKELGTNPSIIQFGAWDSQKKGLLAGERLGLQLRTLEETYRRQDQRRFELTQSISLKLLNPAELINLVSNGSCTFTTSDALFNLDFPDGALKNFKIRSVAFSLPCVTGPYIGTHLKVTHDGSGEEIITSTGVNDPAVFEPNINAAHYMPFEYQPAAGTWRVQLPQSQAFDYSTISDLVLRFQLEAEPAVGIPASSANPQTNHAALLLSWRHDFPQAWYQLLEDAPSTLSGYAHYPTLQPSQIPYQFRHGTTTFGSSPDTTQLYYLLDEDDQLVMTAVTSAMLGDTVVLDGQLEVNGKSVHDVWMLYPRQ